MVSFSAMSTFESPLMEEAVPSTPGNKPINPWLFVPLLYFMQAIPVTLVQDVSTIFYKDLGIANEPITRWTSLISLPWSLQLLFGPLVDLNSTKRKWIQNGQILIAIGIILAAILLRLPNPFEFSLLVLGATAITSALCNIASDGFYMLALPKESQAKYVGVQTTCYRLGRLFCSGILVLLVGILMRIPDVNVRSDTPAYLTFSKGGQYIYARSTKLQVEQGVLVSEYGKLTPEIVIPGGTYGIQISPEGTVEVQTVTGKATAGTIQASFPSETARMSGDILIGGKPELAKSNRFDVRPEMKFGMVPSMAWSLVMLFGGIIYLLGLLILKVTLPKPASDAASEGDAKETRLNILRTLLLVGIGVGGYFLLNATLRITLHFVGPVLQSMTGFDPHGWILKPDNKIILGSLEIGFGAVGTEVFQFLVCAAILGGCLFAAPRLIKGTPMADALFSFVKQPGFPSIFAFVLFYRFGEAMVVKMSPLFLKDAIDKGGLAINNEQLGIIKGFIGVIGIIAGGLVGGWVVSKVGLRKAFLPLAVLMHLPIMLYAYAAWQGSNLPLGLVSAGPLGTVPLTLAGIDFAEQFGYGFGFAAYMIYIMWVAQRGNYKTSHYAIGMGMGALCIAIAGAVSGVLQQNFGYKGFFLWAIFLAIPGVISILFVPLDENLGLETAKP